jgi:hypothetical protein
VVSEKEVGEVVLVNDPVDKSVVPPLVAPKKKTLPTESFRTR